MRALDDSDPRLIGRFAVLGLLGAGGMGRVYLARPVHGPDHPDALVAVKVIRPELADDGPFRERFRREVAAAARVNALFTAEVVDADPDAAAPWLATRYLPGRTLAEEIAEHGPFDDHRLRGLALRLAEVLAAVHATGVVHRDLKPSNVLLAADGPRLIDFGIAAAMDLPSLTGTGMVVGTPTYMSPEQIDGGRPVGPPSDVFSLGGLLVTAATGREPFRGATTPAALLYRIVHGEPDLSGVPARLRDLVARCLAKDPAARPTARRIIDEILGVPGHEPAQPLVSAPSTVIPGPEQTPPPRRRRRGPLVALALVIATVAAGAISWQSLPGQTGTPPPPPTVAPVAPVAPAATARGIVTTVEDPRAIGVGGNRVAVLSPDTATVTVFDLAGTQLTTFASKPGAAAVAVSPDGTTAAVAGSDAVTVHDLADGRVVTGAWDGPGAAAVTYTRDGKRILLADLAGSVIRDMELGSMIPVRTAVLDPQDVAESPDGRQIFVPNGRANTVTVVDAVAGRAGAVVQVGQFPTAATVSPDGTRAYVTNTGSDTVSVLDTATAQIVATVPVGDAPSDVAASPDGAWIYVADNGSGTVTVIDAATATVAATVPAGRTPNALAVAPDSSRVYVVDGTTDTITLLQRP
jgi:YVTN family beta-propeller protein